MQIITKAVSFYQTMKIYNTKSTIQLSEFFGIPQKIGQFFTHNKLSYLDC
jgi:uncharacterized protein with PQ loop repeat